ncbi:hypothetical protein GCM10027280_55700 [Micromonospora polyrhachis]|uniref:Uncharacterized protein n=1 Tax=Micromonospora polyrhachis TaxID=1282883 RepID=A0A7W7ST72_9ACTN|nr:hypothetical protein [Micromonospora polyrhachis]MBB4960508.1 hypothetical protein [Micromonospora polyrhachis]
MPPAQPFPAAQAIPEQPAPPTQPIPVQSAPPTQAIPVQSAPPTQAIPAQSYPPGQPSPAGYPGQPGGYPVSGPPGAYSVSGPPGAYPVSGPGAYPVSGQPDVYPAGGPPGPFPPGAPAVFAAGAPGPVVAQIGEIMVAPPMVRTPAGDIPLAGSSWHIQDYWQTEQKIPTWAIVCAVVGFCILTVFSLLFLLAKETIYRGTVQVTVANAGRQYVARIPVTDQTQVHHLNNQINYVRSLAAAN